MATGTRRIRTLLTPLGMFAFVLLVTLIVIGAVLFDKLLKFHKVLDPPLNLVISLPMICFGLFMTGWSVFNFAKVKGTPVPFNPPPKLVDTGPYAITRNPMLTGVFFILLGAGALLGSISLVCIFTPVFIALMALELKMIEEPELEKRLGKEYVEYKERTPMFFPGLKGMSRKRPKT
jgi:protein-S-isoprenylcysteine O-methyltransferase Ste14